MCYAENPEKIVEHHEKDMIAALRTLRNNLPRTMVNLVTPPSEQLNYFRSCSRFLFKILLGMRVIAELRGKPSECETTHYLECPCAFGLAYRNKREHYFDIMERWKEVGTKVSRMEEFNREVLSTGLRKFNEVI